MLILLLHREHLFGIIGANHNVFGKGDNVVKIPKWHQETPKGHLKLEHFSSFLKRLNTSAVVHQNNIFTTFLFCSV